jgi:TonB family protein
MASIAGEKASPARREKFGKFVLLEQVDAANLGVEYRAAKLGSAGLEKIVDLLRLSNVLSANADAAKTLMDQAKFAAQLQNANVLKIFGIGKVEGSYYISYEFVEGKSLKTIFNRCRSEGFPFSVDHALLIASKICSALEYAHSRKLDGGGRYFHGLVTPGNVIVSYEGEVRVRGFGYWPSKVRELGLVGDDEIIYVAPEQAAGGAGEPRSDTFAVGAILYEALTGQPLLMADRKQDISLRIQNARLQGPSGDEDALPKPIADILNKALAADPGHRYAEIQEMRKGIDTLLFSGDFTPTTFNLAFFMHSLFREDIERESKVLKDEKDANYFEFLDDVKKTPLPTAEVAKPEPPKVEAPRPVPPPPPAPTPAPISAGSSLPLIPPPPPDAPIRTSPPPAMTPVPISHTAHMPAHAPAPVAGMSAKEAAAGLTFHKSEPKSKAPLFAGLAVVGIAVVIGAVFALKGGNSTPPAPVATPVPAQRTSSPEEIAAQQELQRVKDELAAMKAQQEAAAKKAEEDELRKRKQEAEKKGVTITPEELEKAASAARTRAEEEEKKKQAQRAKELEEQQQRAAAEQERVRQEAEAKSRAEAETKAAEAARAAASSTSAPEPSGGSDSGKAVQVGDLVTDIDAPGVVRPQSIRQPRVVKPQRAITYKITGMVIVSVLVDENGKPTDTKLIRKIEHPMGQDCNIAAVQAVKQMEFRPGTKDGVRVKMWIPIQLNF